MQDYRYAGFWIRVVALLIDGLIVGFIMGIMLGVFFRPEMGEGMRMAMHPTIHHYQEYGVSLIQLVNLAIHWLYKAGLESSKYQATLGKRVMGLYVTDTEGNRITFLRATGRWLGSLLSSVLLGIGFLMVAFTKKKQGLHDLLADTFVLKR